MACSGNASEYCGGPGALNLYSYQGATPVSSVIVTATPTPVTSIPLPSAWATLGCYTDNDGARGLSNELNIPSLTVEKCISGCANAGFTIAGVEYGDECVRILRAKIFYLGLFHEFSAPKHVSGVVTLKLFFII